MIRLSLLSLLHRALLLQTLPHLCFRVEGWCSWGWYHHDQTFFCKTLLWVSFVSAWHHFKSLCALTSKWFSWWYLYRHKVHVDYETCLVSQLLTDSDEKWLFYPPVYLQVAAAWQLLPPFPSLNLWTRIWTRTTRFSPVLAPRFLSWLALNTLRICKILNFDQFWTKLTPPLIWQGSPSPPSLSNWLYQRLNTKCYHLSSKAEFF